MAAQSAPSSAAIRTNRDPVGARLSPAVLAARYAAFAAVATGANVAAQWATFTLYHGPFSLALAIAVGTGIGLVFKYILDKNWVFFDVESGFHAHGRKFALYTLMGLATTAIFWGTETVFHLVFTNPAMTYVGAVLGLAVGYYTKYRLDRRFVFRSAVP